MYPSASISFRAENLVYLRFGRGLSRIIDTGIGGVADRFAHAMKDAMVPPFTGASVQQRLLRAMCITGMEARVPRKGGVHRHKLHDTEASFETENPATAPHPRTDIRSPVRCPPRDYW